MDEFELKNQLLAVLKVLDDILGTDYVIHDMCNEDLGIHLDIKAARQYLSLAFYSTLRI